MEYNVCRSIVWTIVFTVVSSAMASEVPRVDTARGDRMIAAYFRNEARKLANACLDDVESWDDWIGQQKARRQELREMLGLDPMPERTPLRPVVTGKVDHPDFTVENVHFQSRPQLYVTGNLYLPKNANGKLPAILYVCGHSRAEIDGVSYGNKTKYQHQGAWFARNGYVCLVIDTLQLGEIEGVHHGTYRENMWWWNARGYTPAGVEAWNAIRALDYLETRPEVDATRLGVTGRSGGGAHSWYLTALDDRIKCLVPVAGITNLKNHVVDGCVEGHCDCMYVVNTYRWDYPIVAALSAPRPVLLSNSDQDHIFPLDGVMDIHGKLEDLYALSRMRENLGLHITVGLHKDTQVLQLHAFNWFNRHFKNDEGPITGLAEPYFTPQQLKVFDTLPADEINTRVHETFVSAAPIAEVPESRESWAAQRAEWMNALSEKCFRGWPSDADAVGTGLVFRPVFEADKKGVRFAAYDFESDHDITLRLYLLLPAGTYAADLDGIVLRVMAEEDWTKFLAAMQVDFADQVGDESPPGANRDEYEALRQAVKKGRGLAFVAPRGVGPTAWTSESLEHTHIRRRFMLLGQTLDGMRVWDVRRALHALRSIDGMKNVPISLAGESQMSGIALYAALFEPYVESLDLHRLPSSHREGPDFLNVLRILDVPQTVAMVATKSHVRIHGSDADAWEFPLAVAEKFAAQRVEIEQSALDE
jgi:cephalosporin-C deacetylase-like acetyl esterase